MAFLPKKLLIRKRSFSSEMLTNIRTNSYIISPSAPMTVSAECGGFDLGIAVCDIASPSFPGRPRAGGFCLLSCRLLSVVVELREIDKKSGV